MIDSSAAGEVPVLTALTTSSTSSHCPATKTPVADF